MAWADGQALASCRPPCGPRTPRLARCCR